MFNFFANISDSNYIHIISRILVRCFQCLFFISFAKKTLILRNFKNLKIYKNIATVILIILTLAVYLFGSRYFSYSYINFIFVFLSMAFVSIFFKNSLIHSQIIIFTYFIAFNMISHISYHVYNMLGLKYNLSVFFNSLVPALMTILLCYLTLSILLPRVVCFKNTDIDFKIVLILFILSFIGFLCLSFGAVNNNLLMSSFLCLILTLSISVLMLRLNQIKIMKLNKVK